MNRRGLKRRAMRELLGAILFAAPTLAAAQGLDRVSLVGAEQRRCQNTILSNAQATALLAQGDLSLPGLYACEANLVVAGVPQDQLAHVSGWLSRGQLPPNLRERASDAARYCIISAHLHGRGG